MKIVLVCIFGYLASVFLILSPCLLTGLMTRRQRKADHHIPELQSPFDQEKI